MSTFDIEEFKKSPTAEKLTSCQLKKTDWINLANEYNIKYKQQWKKAKIKNEVIETLVTKEVLLDWALDLLEEIPGEVDPEVRKLELEFERERLKFEQEKFKLELEEREKEREEKEKERKEKEKERKHQLEMIDRTGSSTGILPSTFDVSKQVKLIPEFVEKDPAEFFIQFEKLALSLKWPRDYWPVLVQSALKGKGLSAYLALSELECNCYETVKDSILQSYQLTAEYYRNKFRSSRKNYNESYIEFAHNVEKLMTRWLTSSGVDTLEGLKELVVLEQFLLGVPHDVKVYLLEREVDNLQRASHLAENYSLVHSSSKAKSWHNQHSASQRISNSFQGKSTSSSKNEGTGVNFKSSVTSRDSSSSYTPICYHCKKPGHVMSNCYFKHGKPGAKKDTNVSLACNVTMSVSGKDEIDEQQKLFEHFQYEGFLSLEEGSAAVPVKIMRDTFSNVSIVVKDMVPFVEEAYTGERVELEGVFGPQVVRSVPVCRLFINAGFKPRYVKLAVVENQLPAKGVALLLGNDIAGRHILPSPIVTTKPLEESPTKELEEKMPWLFPACAVTRSQSARVNPDDKMSAPVKDKVESVVEMPVENKTCGVDLPDVSDWGEPGYNLESLFGGEPEVDKREISKNEDFDFSKVPITQELLVKAQLEDKELTPLFSQCVSEVESKKESRCYYNKEGVLMRKFRPYDAKADEVWNETHQIVLPTCYRTKVMNLAHDYVGGHFGIKKTKESILKHFYWPRIHKSVSQYCKTCKVCQITGKPNQVIKPAPLKPIPVTGEPFSKVIIDCVGPLPKTKSGHQYLLTIMCCLTRYPEAIPLRNIKAKTIIPVLIKFFTNYGFPKIVQSDQGTNFVSGIFQEVMATLGIEQFLASAYHPQSQGALERLHQTLKSLLTRYCSEHGKDWDTGVPFVLYAIRSTCQESLGYSPHELLFGNEVRGPLKLLKESWLNDDKSMSLSEYVVNLKAKLEEAHKIAKNNFGKAQETMKENFDQKAEIRDFKVGDKVLLFLPTNKAPFQAKYEGPYEILSKENDVNYVIWTPGKRKEKRLVHVNLIKPYHVRDSQISLPVSKISLSKADPTNYTKEERSDFTVDTGEIKLNNSDVLSNLTNKLSHLSQKQQADLANLLNEFKDLFGDVPRQTNITVHDIALKEGSQPVRQAPYRLPPQKREVLKKEIDFLLENNLAVPSQSEWASPCLLVPKSDGSYRMCTDYRKVNDLTCADSYPLPRIDDIVDSVGQATYVTKLDLLRGYYQIKLSDKAKKISAFITSEGLFEYTVMPFGMKCAPATFQRLMNTVIAGMKGVQAYLDDLVVSSNSWEEHLALLRQLLMRLRSAGLTVNLVKSDFAQAKIEYLGYMVGGGVLTPIYSKVWAIHQYPAPTTRKEVQRYLGMIGYYRRFIRNFSQIAVPLTDLTSSKKKFKWTDDCQEAFEKLKKFLMMEPVLKAPDFTKPFILQVDACDDGVGAVLLQEFNGERHPICYYSAKLKPHQRPYSTVEKEALSLILALEKFHVYLGSTGQKIVVHSDHNPLKFVNQLRLKNQRLARWALALQPYNLEIQHIRGRENVLADALSRGIG